jgi:HSP20 family molecular chaperone IbpA
MEAQKQFANQTSELQHSQRVFAPATDIYESEDNLLLLADMPGVKQDDIEITLEQNILTIAGRVVAPTHQGYLLTYSEYGIGGYRRVFALSNEIDRDGIQASMKDGVLKLVLAKSKRALPRKIAVQSE